jgi:hypothetical protein
MLRMTTLPRRARPGSRALACLCLSAFAAVSAPAPALAEACEPDAASRAEAHKQLGLHLRGSDPAGAAEEFEAAAAICPDPWYEGLLAVCYEKTGRIVDAIGAIDSYLKASGVNQRDQAVAARARLVAMLAKVEVVTEPRGASVRLTGPRLDVEVIAPTKLSLDPGHYEIDVRLEGQEPQHREVDVAAGERARIDVALSAASQGSGDAGGPRAGTQANRTRAWTGAAGLALDVAIPMATDVFNTAAGFALDFCGGIELRRARAELALQLDVFPNKPGDVLELVGGPRFGVRLGSIPLFLELDVLVGFDFMNIRSADAFIPPGTYTGLSISTGIAVSYRVLRWLEVFVRPARVEMLNIANDEAGGALFRWNLDAGVRFRR